MRLVHLSDLHLGYRQFQRLTPKGLNQREADVAGAFRRAVDLTATLRPDVVLIGGDVFHTVRPTNTAIMHAFRQFGRLRSLLPEATLVMVAGNHDLPRTTETGCILRLFADVGVHVVDSEPQRLSFPERELSVLAVPDAPAARQIALDPDPAFRHNVLLLHGEVEGMLPAWAAQGDRTDLEITREQLGASRWDYVALGHYHVYREIAPNAFYSGSIEYTSTNPWGELEEERRAGVPGKGLIEYDLATRSHRFHHLPPARPWIDLPRLEARGMGARELDAAVAAAAGSVSGGIDDKVVRLVMRDVPRHVLRDMDHKAIRELKRRALHFHLDARRPEATTARSASGAPFRRPSLLETVRERLQARPLDPSVDRASLVALGLRYLEEATAAASIAPAESVLGDALAASSGGAPDTAPDAP